MTWPIYAMRCSEPGESVSVAIDRHGTNDKNTTQTNEIEHDASPNGVPAKRLGNLGVTEAPALVS